MSRAVKAMPCSDGCGGMEKPNAQERPDPAKFALLIAFHYPPCQESSGYLRTLAFSRYLLHFGWNPVVLTASARAYSEVDAAQCDNIPSSVPVVRAFARDAREHFSIRHKYFNFLDIPDRWSSWWLGAVPIGLRLIHRYRPRVLWATQPNPTAFLIAHTLHRLTKVPWIADFRDPIGPAENPSSNRMRHWIESKTVHGCSRAVFTTQGAAAAYATRYRDIPADRWTVIPNGYEESDFSELEKVDPVPRQRCPLQIVHSGALNPDGRDPRALFSAIVRLKEAGGLSGGGIKLILRASGNEEYYRKLIDRENIDNIVELRPSVPRKQALAELCRADGLLLIQGRKHNEQIPAKIYEYMRSRRPILALTDPTSNTADVLREAGIDAIAPIDRVDKVAITLANFIADVRAGTAAVSKETTISRYSREAGARQLSKLFNEVVAS